MPNPAMLPFCNNRWEAAILNAAGQLASCHNQKDSE
jgi:hypothetical protein